MYFTIRNMKKKDVQQVQDVARVSWHTTYKEIIPEKVQENFLNAAYSDKMMAKRLQESFIYISEVNGKIVGFANFSKTKNVGQAELSAIYLYPDYQDDGIGSALLQEGIKSLNLKEIVVDVEKENVIGRSFYQAKGFKVVKEYDDNFDGHLLRTVRMKLVL